MLRINGGGGGGGSVIAGPFKKRLGRALYEFEAYTGPVEGTHSCNYKSRETAPTVKDRFIKRKTTGSILPLTRSLSASMTGYKLLTKMRRRC